MDYLGLQGAYTRQTRARKLHRVMTWERNRQARSGGGQCQEGEGCLPGDHVSSDLKGRKDQPQADRELRRLGVRSQQVQRPWGRNGLHILKQGRTMVGYVPGEDTMRWRGVSGHGQVPSTAGSHWQEKLHRRQVQP